MKKTVLVWTLASAFLAAGAWLTAADECCGCGGGAKAKEAKECPPVVEVDEGLCVEYDGKLYFACDRKCFEKLKANPAECLKTCKSMKPVVTKSGKKGFIVYGHEKVDTGNSPRVDSGNAPSTNTNNAPSTDTGNAPSTDTNNAPSTDTGNTPKQDTGNTPKQTDS